MDAGDESPLQQFGREAGLGKLLWAPAEDITKRAEHAGSSRAMGGLLVAVLGAAAIVGGSAIIGPGGYSAATGLMILGALAIVLGLWVARSAKIAGSLLVGVFENGVLLPSSFESAPDLATVGGPRALRRSEIEKVERLELDGERALVFWAKFGRNGVLTARLEGAALSAYEAAALVDSFDSAFQKAKLDPGLAVDDGEPKKVDTAEQRGPAEGD